MRKGTDKYEDIIYMEHPTSRTHPRMSVLERAAQFSPFAALTGHDAAIKETARLTDHRTELDEYEKRALDQVMQEILSREDEELQVTITYFVADAHKEGGSYRTVTGIVKKVFTMERYILFTDFTKIPLDDIVEMNF